MNLFWNGFDFGVVCQQKFIDVWKSANVATITLKDTLVSWPKMSEGNKAYNSYRELLIVE